ncbi:hypothetical protein Taro_009917 [Colocasia esculenta]|uniref:Uncharacterized protein n=1 Tax=Colocasia esculenta TaxID=4460 RepID=A0A843U686_COLES|nr:hypothetical protein [Colocasia esculenta]
MNRGTVGRRRMGKKLRKVSRYYRGGVLLDRDKHLLQGWCRHTSHWCRHNAQALRQKMKKWSSSVDTRPGQADTRDRSQRNMLTGFNLRSTLNQMVSTLESLPRRPVFQMATAGRHEMISGRH